MSFVLQGVPEFAAFIFVASLKTTLLVALVLLIKRVAGKLLSAGARYLLWLSVVISLVTPVGFDMVLPAGVIADARDVVAVPAAPSANAANVPERQGSISSFSLPASSVEAEPVAIRTPALSWLPYLWLAGVLMVLGAIAVSSYRFGQLVRRATTAPESVQTFLKDCMRHTSCTKAVTALHSTNIQVPMIAGLFRPVLLLPEGLEQRVSREQLRHVFIHELMHLQRGDIAGNWIVAVVQALHWFNPVVWLAFFCMRQDRELACDAATLKHLAPSDRAAYGHTLLQLNDALPRKAVPALALGVLGSASHLQTRIRMLVQAAQPRKLQSFIAALLVAPLAAVAFSQPVSTPAVTPRVVAAQSVPHADVIPAEPAAVPAAPVEEPPAVPAIPATQEIPEIPARPVEQSRTALDAVVEESALVETPLLAQLDVQPVVDAFAPADQQDNLIVAALSTGQPDAANTEPAPELPQAILKMTEEINTLKADRLRVIEEWNRIALDCQARKDDSLFGTLSKPCREVRVVQIRGDVFRFVYACQVLGVQQTAQWAAWREAVAQQQTGLNGAEEALLANQRELEAFCSKATYANEYPGFSNMMVDAAGLKYYNPWRKPVNAPVYLDTSYSDPSLTSRMSDMPYGVR